MDLMNLDEEKLFEMAKGASFAEASDSGQQDDPDRFAELIYRLLFDGRDDEIDAAMSDFEYRTKLYQEYDMLENA
ncbi:MAG: hypothetical protein PUC44_03770 [Eubacteriales bacterium]|nr:hypothetical protein [Eubacteriales bacterium]